MSILSCRDLPGLSKYCLNSNQSSRHCIAIVNSYLSFCHLLTARRILHYLLAPILLPHGLVILFLPFNFTCGPSFGISPLFRLRFGNFTLFRHPLLGMLSIISIWMAQTQFAVTH